MTKVQNSLSDIVNLLIKLQRNNSQILTKLSEVVNSDADVVTLTLEDIDNDNIKTVTIPSFGAIKKDIDRLDENIKQLSALDEKDASVKLPDGTFRTIIKSTLKKSANSLTSVQTPTEFESKNNWFFESFLNPLLYVGLKYPSQLDPNTERVKMQKFILNLDTNVKLDIYNNEIKNNPDLTYANFLDIINTNGIGYQIDDDVLDLPPIEPRFYGDFSVLRVFEETEDVIIDGVTATKKNLRFQLDKLSYNDKNSSTLETQQLKIGDSLLVNKNDKNTRYGITNIDFETNTISVDLLEGYDSVSIGANNLSYYPDENIVPEVRVGIGFNEYISVFLKPIDPNSNRPADNFSPGISFYSNDLTIKDTDDVVKNLSTYYQENVVDFGAILFSMAKENIPPVSKAIKPNAPSVTQEQFKVVQINKHATDGQSNLDIRNLNKEKNDLKSQLTELDKSIASKRVEISTKNYKSDIERDTDNNKLNTLIENRAAVETLYNSVINDISSKAKDKTTSSASSKYRMRGFFPLPTKKVASDGTEQEVIQFITEYRYLTKGGEANNLEEYNTVDTDGNSIKGVYSNWVTYKSNIRERAIDSDTGNYYWVEQDISNGEQVNINQLDLPIQPNETLEFRIKSVSEAGYPTTPLESDWSEIISMEFPDDLGIPEDIKNIVKETNEEQVRANLTNDLSEKGVFTHIDDQFTQNSTTWKHNAINIASGFLSDERNVISLFDYLKSLQDEIEVLKAQINQTFGVLLIKIEDENGNQKILQENSTTSIFAGNYKDDVSSLDKPKGTIITKNYFIRIENDAATPIQLISGIGGEFAGSKFERATGIYEEPYIGLSNPSSEDLNNQTKTAFQLPYQSSQVKGQFIYIRKDDITTTKTIYTSNVGGLPTNYYKFDPSSITGATNDYNGTGSTANNDYFVWTGEQTNGTNVIGVKPFVFDDDKTYVHCEHPDLQDGITQDTDWIEENTSISAFANKRFGDDIDYYQQSSFLNAEINGIERSNKLAYKENDKYLLGQSTCGAYMYVSPVIYEDIRVEGNDIKSTKELEQGGQNAIILQLVYQYRMTDYFGPGQDGIGRIGGEEGVTQLEYRKIMGFDVYYDEKKFAFDVEIISRYKSNSISASDIPNATFQNTFNQTTNNVNQITPTIS